MDASWTATYALSVGATLLAVFILVAALALVVAASAILGASAIRFGLREQRARARGGSLPPAA